VIPALITVLVLSFSLGALKGTQICGFACGAAVLLASKGKNRRRYVTLFLLTRVGLMALLGLAVGATLSFIYAVGAALELFVYISAALYTALAFILLFSGWRLLTEALERLFPGEGARWVERRRVRPSLLKRSKGPVGLALLLSIGCVGEVTFLEGALLTTLATAAPYTPLLVTPLSFALFAVGMNLPILPVGLLKDSHFRFLERRPVLYMVLPVTSVVVGMLLLVRYAPLLLSVIL